MSSHTESFTYERFKDASRQLRTLKILAGEGPLRLILTSCDFAPPHPLPLYEAISYAWGHDKAWKQVQIRTPADQRFRPLEVRPNCYDLLLHLRRTDAEEPFWIDAICIDQSDQDGTREKSKQVAMMMNIYSSAKRVVAWIGPKIDENNDVQTRNMGSAKLLPLMQYVASMVKINWATSSLRPIEGAAEGQRRYGDETEGRSLLLLRVMGLIPLFRQPYFERLWIRQELAAQPKNTILRCGDVPIPWLQFIEFVFITWLKPTHDVAWHIQSDLNRYTQIAYRLCHLHPNQQPTQYLLDVLHACRQSLCENPADRIYANLGLIQDAEELAIQVDYGLTPARIYKDAFIKFGNYYKTLNMLAYCEAVDGTLEIPSWVPKWSSGPTRSEFRRTRSCLRIPDLELKSNDAGLLHVRGVRSASIAKIVELPQNLSASAGGSLAEVLVGALKEVASQLNFSLDLVPTGTKVEAFLDAITKAQWKDNQIPPEGTMTRENAIIALDIIRARDLDAKALDDLEHVNQLSALFRFFSRGQAFCITDKGHFGVVPLESRLDDLIFTIPGCSWPMVLRLSQIQEGTKKYNVVGRCHVSGLTENEELLGPLNSEYRSVWISRKDYADVDGPPVAFQEICSGRLRYTDPRLWDDQTQVKWFESNCLRPREDDEKPHMTLSDLEKRVRKRGKELEHLCLV